MSIEAIRQMVAALEDIKDDCAGDEFEWINDYPVQCAALEAGRKALVEAEKQGPVAYVHADELEELSHCNAMSVWAENALAHTEDSLSKQLLPSGYVAFYTNPQPKVDVDELCARHNKIGYKQGYRAGQADAREEAEKQEPVAYVPYGVFDAWLDQAWLGVRCLNPQLCDPDKVDVQAVYAYPKPKVKP